MPILTFETRLRFCFLQSHSSRREREFFHLISGFETRSRVLFASSRPREKIENFCHLISKFETRSRFFNEKGQWCYHWYKVIPPADFAGGQTIAMDRYQLIALLNLFTFGFFMLSRRWQPPICGSKKFEPPLRPGGSRQRQFFLKMYFLCPFLWWKRKKQVKKVRRTQRNRP